MAYRAGGGSYDVFLEWSRQHPDYQSDAYVREQWRSFASAHSVTAATLFAEVFDRFPAGKSRPSGETDYAGAAHAEDEDWEGEPGDEADDAFEEEALRLSPEPRPAEPYPLEALGSLKGVIEDIAESVGCDPALTAQSVLMAAALATAGIANILLPKIGEVGLLALFRDDRRRERTEVDIRQARAAGDQATRRRARGGAQDPCTASQGRCPHLRRCRKRDPEGQETRPVTKSGRG